MAMRSKETTLTFSKAFALSDVDRPLPAGTYRVVIDDEDISGLSFLAFRRIATMLHVPAITTLGGPAEMFLVNPAELAAALEADRVAARGVSPGKRTQSCDISVESRVPAIEIGGSETVARAAHH